MDNLKKMFTNLTDGDDTKDAGHLQAEMGELGLDDLKDLSFPITKAEVLETLKNNGSSDLLIQAVEKVPHDTFNTLNDLRNQLPV